MPLNAPKALDLFSGAGGFSLGAQQAGFEICGALEWSKHAAQTYRSNITNPSGTKYTLIEGDIRQLSPKIALDLWGISEGECDLLLGGPPCQGFSVHRLRSSGVGDPRNELLICYFSYVEKIRPRMFLVENVAGLLWERHRTHLEMFLRKANEAQYTVVGPIVLNACDYGVGQRRKRVFMLGIDRLRPASPNWPPPPSHCNILQDSPNEAKLEPWVDCSSAFRPVLESDSNRVWMNSCSELVDAFRSTPPEGGSRRDSKRQLACHKDHDGHSDVYGRINSRQIAPTMTTACINPSKGRFVHPVEHRGISVREAARIQSFPDSFLFHGGLMAAGEQIGNAVPVLLAKTLVSPLYESLVRDRVSINDTASIFMTPADGGAYSEDVERLRAY